MQEQSGHDKKSFMGYIKVVNCAHSFNAFLGNGLGSHNEVACCSLG